MAQVGLMSTVLVRIMRRKNPQRYSDHRNITGPDYAETPPAPESDLRGNQHPGGDTLPRQVFVYSVRWAYWIGCPVGFFLFVLFARYGPWERWPLVLVSLVLLSWLLYWWWAKARLRIVLKERAVRWEFFWSAVSLGTVSAVTGVALVEAAFGWL